MGALAQHAEQKRVFGGVEKGGEPDEPGESDAGAPALAEAGEAKCEGVGEEEGKVEQKVLEGGIGGGGRSLLKGRAQGFRVRGGRADLPAVQDLGGALGRAGEFEADDAERGGVVTEGGAEPGEENEEQDGHSEGNPEGPAEAGGWNELERMRDH